MEGTRLWFSFQAWDLEFAPLDLRINIRITKKRKKYQKVFRKRKRRGYSSEKGKSYLKHDKCLLDLLIFIHLYKIIKWCLSTINMGVYKCVYMCIHTCLYLYMYIYDEVYGWGEIITLILVEIQTKYHSEEKAAKYSRKHLLTFLPRNPFSKNVSHYLSKSWKFTIMKICIKRWCL